MLDEGCDLSFKVFLEEVALKKDAILEPLMPAFDLAFRLGVAGSAIDLFDLQETIMPAIEGRPGDTNLQVVA
ncbi:hypothetical protein ASG68_29965 [Rhizobium sp. Leaf453]|nr:hypothetical protein ASG68_29965 [Rhizobium sp. Leaf453]